VKEVRIGCSGWSYDDWRERFYPSGTPSTRRLEHYASVFDTVEVNATFYRLPKVETVRAWAEQDAHGALSSPTSTTTGVASPPATPSPFAKACCTRRLLAFDT
jgi:Protein of unknown function DUF72